MTVPDASNQAHQPRRLNFNQLRISHKILLIVLVLLILFTGGISVVIGWTSFNNLAQLTRNELSKMSSILVLHIAEMEDNSTQVIQSIQENEQAMESLKQLTMLGPYFTDDKSLLGVPIEDSDIIYNFQAQLNFIQLVQPLQQSNNLYSISLYLLSPFEMVSNAKPVLTLRVDQDFLFVTQFNRKAVPNQRSVHRINVNQFQSPEPEYFDISSVYSIAPKKFYQETQFKPIPHNTDRDFFLDSRELPLQTNIMIPQEGQVLIRTWAPLKTMVADPETFEEKQVTTGLIVVEHLLNAEQMQNIKKQLETDVALAQNNMLLVTSLKNLTLPIQLPSTDTVTLNDRTFYFSKKHIQFSKAVNSNLQAVTLSDISILKQFTQTLFIQIVIVAAVTMLLTGLILYLGIQKFVTRPLNNLMTGVQVVSSGDLTHRVETGYQNELGELATAFNKMSSELAELKEGLERKVSERTQEITHINQVVQIVNATLDLDKVLVSVMETLQSVFNFDQIAIFLVDDAKENLNIARYFGMGIHDEMLQLIKKISLSIKDTRSYICDVFQSGYPFYMSPVTPKLLEKFSPTDKQLYDIFPVKAYLLYPLQVQKQTIGTITFFNSRASFDLTDEHIDTIQRYVVQIATAINNAHIFDELKSTQFQLAETEKIAAMTKTFEKFVPKQFLNIIASEGLDKIELGKAESCMSSILFSDIRSFTTLSEQMPPQELLNFLNAYLKRMNVPIHDNQGFVDKFIGDAIMAVFNAPDTTDSQEAQNAIQAAIGMQMALEEYNHHRQNSGYIPISSGIGIHSGQVVIGTVGSEDRMDSTVLGDAVNLASRLEGLTKYYNCPIIISSQTHRLIEDDSILCRELDFTGVKGKNRPVSIFEVFNCDPEEIREKKKHTLSQYYEGLMLFHLRRWDEALRLFNECLDVYTGDVVCRMYLERCLIYKKTPPKPDWDGSLQLRTKDFQ